MLTTSLLSLAPDALSDEDVPLDAELLSSVEVAALVELVDEASLLDALAPESLASVIVCGGGGGGGGALAASVPSAEFSDVVVSLVEEPDEEASEDGGGGGGIMVASVPPISSCSDRRADCTSLLSDEKVLPNDTVPDVELLPWLLDEEDDAKAVAADVPLLLEAPKRAARLLVLLVRADRDDICCLRENSLCSFRRGVLQNQARKSWENKVNDLGRFVNHAGATAGAPPYPSTASRGMRESSAGRGALRDKPANRQSRHCRRG